MDWPISVSVRTIVCRKPPAFFVERMTEFVRPPAATEYAQNIVADAGEGLESLPGSLASGSVWPAAKPPATSQAANESRARTRNVPDFMALVRRPPSVL